MDVPEQGRAEGDAASATDLISLTVGLGEIIARGLRTALGRRVPGGKLYDLALGATLVSGEVAARAVGSVRGLGPRALHLLQPPMPRFPLSNRGLEVIRDLQQRGRQARIDDHRAVERVVDILLPVIVEELADRLDLNALVLEHLDIETIIADLDIHAVVDSVDVDSVARRVDLEAILDRIDLNAMVRERLDVDALVQSVDLDAVAKRVDLDAIVERLDLPVLAQTVIDEIDLPAIIRESSGSMASEAARGVRMHSIQADDAVARALDRVLGRRRAARVGSNPVVDGAPVEIREPLAATEPSTRPTP